MDENNRRIFKNTLMLYFRMFVVMGVSLLTAGVTLRVLGAVDYGLMGVLGGIVAMFEFLNGSLSASGSRYITFELGKKNYDRLRHVFNVSLTVHFLLSMIIVALSETIGLWFFYHKMVVPAERMTAAFWVFQLSIIGVPLNMTQVPYRAVLVAHENMTMFAWVDIVNAFIRLLILGLLILSPFDKLITLSSLSFSWGVCVMVFYRLYCYNRYPETHLRICKDFGLVKSMFAFAGSDLVGNLSILAQGQGLNLLLNTFFGPIVNAARNIAYGVQGMVTQFSDNFMMAARPQVIKLYASGEIEEMWTLVIRASTGSYYLLLLLALPVCLEADYLLKLWLGTYPQHTVNFLKLIIIVCLIQSVKSLRTAVLHATGRILFTNVLVGSMLCATFPAAYLALKAGYRPESVFIASAISIASTELVAPFILKRYVRFDLVHYYLSVHVRCVVVTVVACAMPIYLYNKIFDQGFVRLCWTGMLSTLSVVAASFYLGLDRETRAKVLMIIGERVQLLRSVISSQEKKKGKNHE